MGTRDIAINKANSSAFVQLTYKWRRQKMNRETNIFIYDMRPE